MWHFMMSISLCHVVHIAPPSRRPEVIVRRTLFRESFRLKKITRVNSSLMMHPDLPEYQVKIAIHAQHQIHDSAFCMLYQTLTTSAYDGNVSLND